MNFFDGLLKFAVDNLLIDAAIVGVGLVGIVIIFERGKAFFVDYALDVDKFMSQVMGLLKQDKVEDAITFCAANEKKPLPFVIKAILEKSDRDEKSIDAALDLAAGEVGPKLTVRMGHLPMVSNVVTLVGLLGTVAGLIMAFKAVSFADPSQKQTLLADGIALAMHATMLGLCFAIPVMFCYSFLHAKQQQHFNDIDKAANGLVEYLKERSLTPVNTTTTYPSNLGKGDFKTPPTPSRAS